MKIVPAPLEESLEGVKTQLTRLVPYFDRFSIDILDGTILPAKTVPIRQIVEYLESNASHFQGKTFDFDLMSTQYEDALDQIEKLAQTVTVGNIVILKDALQSSQFPTRNGLVIGLSIDYQDYIEDLAHEYNLDTIPVIQIMTIHAGAQGLSFIPDSLNKIDQLRVAGYRSKIYIDGGVNNDSLPIILSQKNLPDFACVGSFLTKASDEELKERVEYLHSIEK